MASVAERLKEFRKLQSMGQQEISEIMGVSRIAYAKYERGDVIPSVDKLIKLAKNFDVSLDWLCGLSSSPEKETNIKTVADFIKILYKLNPEDIILESVTRPDNSLFFTTSLYYGEQYSTLSHSLIDYKQLKELHDKGAISDDLFQASIIGMCEKYKDTPLKDF